MWFFRQFFFNEPTYIEWARYGRPTRALIFSVVTKMYVLSRLGTIVWPIYMWSYVTNDTVFRVYSATSRRRLDYSAKTSIITIIYGFTVVTR